MLEAKAASAATARTLGQAGHRTEEFGGQFGQLLFKGVPGAVA
ncbi:MAG: hypothetical protein JWO94_1784, partial [Verrucomicrobiaceae bacterium]|nr:hypothetical protein [Verrucomicrobiaceae bacterium]